MATVCIGLLGSFMSGFSGTMTTFITYWLLLGLAFALLNTPKQAN